MFDKYFKSRHSGQYCPEGQCKRKHRKHLIPVSYAHDLPVPITISPYKQRKQRQVRIGKVSVHGDPQKQSKISKLIVIKKNRQDSYDDSEKGCIRWVCGWFAKRKALKEIELEHKKNAKRAEQWRKWKFEEAERIRKAEREKAELEREAEYERQLYEIEQQKRDLAKNTLKTRYPHPVKRKIPKFSFGKLKKSTEPKTDFGEVSVKESRAEKRDRKRREKEEKKRKNAELVPFDEEPRKNSKFKSYFKSKGKKKEYTYSDAYEKEIDKSKGKKSKEKTKTYTDPYANLYDNAYKSKKKTKEQPYTDPYEQLYAKPYKSEKKKEEKPYTDPYENLYAKPNKSEKKKEEKPYDPYENLYAKPYKSEKKKEEKPYIDPYENLYAKPYKSEKKKEEIPYTDPYEKLYDKRKKSKDDTKSYTEIYNRLYDKPQERKKSCTDTCKYDKPTTSYRKEDNICTEDLYSQYYDLYGGTSSDTKKKNKNKNKKEKKKKPVKEKRKSSNKYSRKFVNCFYRTCCECYCWFSFFLIIGFVLIMVV